ncbi:MAG TPA: RNA polymerase sigma factor [Candidatus Dormibacteraeota bacterium]|nr:RNA polymerase sigma factor [Candidatus Dormibacteraeota bacterium]
MADETDQELLEALGRGEPEAIAAVYRRHGGRMVAFALRYVTDRSAAEDVVVDLIGRWLERPPRIAEVNRISAFLATSVYHAAIDWLRRERSEQGQSPRSQIQAAPDRRLAGPISIPASTPAVELRERIAGALDRVPPADRLLLESHYGRALSAEECMTELGITRAAFHQRLHRARTRLARLLELDETSR